MIFQGLIEWLYGLFLEIVEYIANSLLDVFSMDLAYFQSVMPVTDDIFGIIVASGWAFLLGNLVFQAAKSMLSGLGFEGEDPKVLFARTFVCGFLLLASRQICGIGLGLSESVMDLLQVPDAIVMNMPTADEFPIGASWLLAIIVNFILMFQLVKLFLEVGERYFLVGFLTITAPWAFAMGGSKSTGDILAGWVRMFASMCFLMAVNVVFLKLLLSAMNHTPSGTAIIPWAILVIAIARSARKIDSVIARIGLNPAITGDGLGRVLPGALSYMVMKSAVSAVTRAMPTGRHGGTGRSGASGGPSPSPQPPPASSPSGSGATASAPSGASTRRPGANGSSATATGGNPTPDLGSGSGASGRSAMGANAAMSEQSSGSKHYAPPKEEQTSAMHTAKADHMPSASPTIPSGQGTAGSGIMPDSNHARPGLDTIRMGNTNPADIKSVGPAREAAKGSRRTSVTPAAQSTASPHTPADFSQHMRPPSLGQSGDSTAVGEITGNGAAPVKQGQGSARYTNRPQEAPSNLPANQPASGTAGKLSVPHNMAVAGKNNQTRTSHVPEKNGFASSENSRSGAGIHSETQGHTPQHHTASGAMGSTRESISENTASINGKSPVQAARDSIRRPPTSIGLPASAGTSSSVGATASVGPPAETAHGHGRDNAAPSNAGIQYRASAAVMQKNGTISNIRAQTAPPGLGSGTSRISGARRSTRNGIKQNIEGWDDDGKR